MIATLTLPLASLDAWNFIARNWALMSILVTILLTVTICSMVLWRYIKLTLNILKDTPPPLSMAPMDFEHIEGTEVTFRSFDGLLLSGALHHANPNTKRKGMIIFCHEFNSNMHSVARYCKPLIESGYDVFSFDFRGHGQSPCDEDYQPRQWVSNHEVNDVLGAFAFTENYLESNNFPVELGIFGISRGAGAAILASMHNPTIKAITTDGLFSSDATMEDLMKRWAGIFAKVRFVYENHHPLFWKFLCWALFKCANRKFNCKYLSVRKALSRTMARPMLMIHGKRDSYIPSEQAQTLFNLAAEPKSLWIVPGAKHNQAAVISPEEYAQKTVSFFDHYLADPIAITKINNEAITKRA